MGLPGAWKRIRWERADEPALAEFASDQPGTMTDFEAPSVPGSALDSLKSLFDDLGVPTVPGSTSLQEAQILLKAGAEVEHALLVEYLYAFWSLAGSPAASSLLEIAIQEMCHLITVQNLLLFTGDLPYLHRQDEDPTPELAPFAFALRPFSKAVLEDFLLAEMPPLEDMSIHQKQVMQPIIKAHPGGGVHPVGAIYARVFWLFQQDDQATDPWPDVARAMPSVDKGHIATFPGESSAATFQVDPINEQEWHRSHDRGGVFALIDSRRAALNAIAAIAAQGEGLAPQPAAPSHFSIFLDMHETMNFTVPFSPLRPTDPFVSDTPAADQGREANRITHPLAAALCGVFDARYRILLAAIRAALSRDRTNQQDVPFRAKYAKWAVEEMQSSIVPLAGAIGALPCKDGGTASQLSAAPTFDLSGLSLPSDSKALDDLLLTLHLQAGNAISLALAKADPDTTDTLQDIQQLDHGRFPNA